MTEGLEQTGIPSKKELQESPGYIDEERMKKGPVVVIECIQSIACDACVTGCPTNCIKVDSLIGPPKIDKDKCIGCSLCIPSCPGLAIFTIDYTYSKDKALISFGYELLPLPKIDDIVNATNREGKIVTKVRIVKVLTNKQFDKTTIITIEVPKKFIYDVRGIHIKWG